MTVTIYHNPNCGTSRNVLAAIRNSGEEPEIVEYLKTPPSREALVALVALCIAAGLVLGNLLPGAFAALASWEYASVNLVVAVLIWAMVYPMMVAVDFASLRHGGDPPKGLVLTVVVNWVVKPFTMAALAVLFFEHVFAGLIAPADAQGYIAGLILLGAAPCTAMVFVWSQLTRGDPTYTLVQVSVNDVIMIFAFAPIVALLLGVTDIVVPWETLLLSVGLYVVIPLSRRRADAALAASAPSTRRAERPQPQLVSSARKPLVPSAIIGLRVGGGELPRPLPRSGRPRPERIMW